MSFHIKTATINDLDTVLKLNYLLFQKEFNDYDKTLNMGWTYGEKGRTYFTERLIGVNSRVLLAEKDNQVIGYLVGSIRKPVFYRAETIFAELENMFVMEEYRDRGAGSLLFQEFVKWCRDRKVDSISVNAFAGNHLGINFYKKNGFKEHDLTLEMEL